MCTMLTDDNRRKLKKMARKNRTTNSKKSTQNRSRRGNLSTASRRLHRDPPHKALPRVPLNQIQDDRFFSPLKKELRPLLNIMGSPVEVKAIPLLRKYSPHALFQIDMSALLCARRAIRKEVLFSKGRGGSKVKKPSYNEKSKLNCRRK